MGKSRENSEAAQPTRLLGPAAAGPTQLAIAGWPVLASGHPQMFRGALEATGRGAVGYLRLAASSGAGAVVMARELGLSGFNVTAPFKEAICESLDSLCDCAREVGAVNTVVFDGQAARGHNTDPHGAERALDHAGGIDGSAVVLGTGCAGRAACVALARGGAKTITVVGRDERRGRAVAAALGVKWEPSAGCQSLCTADLVVSCLPPSVPLPPPPSPQPGAVLIDAVYGQPGRLGRYRRRGWVCHDGTEWLLGQGVAAFELLTGSSAPAAVMAQALLGTPPPAGRPLRPVALIGLSGAGKSAVARELAGLTGAGLLDTDELVTDEAGVTVDAIFSQEGEPGFRRRERGAVARALESGAGVVALGGGALGSAETCRRLRDEATCVWLWVAPAEAASRIGLTPRPLVRREQAEADLTRLLGRRLANYRRASDLVIDTSGATVREIARRIVAEIGSTR